MKNLDTYITEKILINKNTKIIHRAKDHIDELTCCDELYSLLDELWNDPNFITDEYDREDYFDAFINGDRCAAVDGALEQLVERGRLSESDADEYSNNETIMNVCDEIVRCLQRNLEIDINQIYDDNIVLQ